MGVKDTVVQIGGAIILGSLAVTALGVILAYVIESNVGGPFTYLFAQLGVFGSAALILLLGAGLRIVVPFLISSIGDNGF
ncbi:hypothetical protein [Halobellus marinus]|uniref:hypothetical protein n=1 Tax=Halobellus sp. GCM10025813 TaxID=3252665 RepID=UPI0036219750